MARTPAQNKICSSKSRRTYARDVRQPSTTDKISEVHRKRLKLNWICFWVSLSVISYLAAAIFIIVFDTSSTQGSTGAL